MATTGSSSPGRVSPAQQNASDSTRPLPNRAAPVIADNNAAERKTATNVADTNAEPNKVYFSTSSAGTNILNNYRSVSYNFTLVALTPSQVNGTEKIDLQNPPLVIATSKGKSKLPEPFNKKQKIQKSKNYKNDKLDENSNGLFLEDFDLFIDDVSLEGLFAFQNGLKSVQSSINFEIIEPYSINGFIEQMQIAAVTAGYTNYQAGKYGLIVDFIGYPDKGDTPLPVSIPYSSRLFPITISGVQVTVKEVGVIYKVSTVVVGELAEGSTISPIKKSISASGNTVKELLTDLVNGLNKQAEESASSSPNSKQYDDYQIIFPVYDDKGEIIPNVDNEIASEKFYEDIAAANANPAMTPIGQTSSGYNTDKPKNSSLIKKESQSTAAITHTSNFEANTPIGEIIALVIRDSNFVQRVVKAFATGGDPNSVIDAQGFVKYFIVTPKVILKDGTINPLTHRPYTTYVFMVQVYKTLYNMAVPGTANQNIKVKEVTQLSLRNYNYFYTGMNVDIIDFKINLNNLFFEEVPPALGNNQEDSSADAAKPSNSRDIVQNNNNDSTDKSKNYLTPQYATANANSLTPNGAGTSAPPDPQSLAAMRKMMHEKVSNSIGLIQGELSILGDPYYLTTNGSGNSPNKNSRVGQASNDGEASIRAGIVLISLTFNNPSDIDESGFIQFDNSSMPISGLYQITSVKSTFKDGLFKQNLSILRVPGQPNNAKQPADNPASTFSSKPNLDNKLEISTGPNPPSQTVTTNDGTTDFRTSALNLKSVITSDSTNNPGGLGGNDNTVFGAINPAGSLPTAIYGTVPSGVNQLASGIRASAAGLYSAQNSTVGNAALALGTSKILNSAYPSVANIENKITSKLINADYQLKNSLGINSLNAAFSNVAGDLNNVGNTVNQLINKTSNDVLGLSNLFNINSLSVSGLSGALNSKILSSLNGLSNVIPNNVNLQTASAQGVRIDGLTSEGLSKLPPIPAQPTGIRSAGFSDGNPISYASLNNPLTTLSQSANNAVDSLAQLEKTSSALSLYSQISNNPLSVEANYSIAGKDQTVYKSVTTLYQSKSKNEISPLINALNNTTA